jgi:hypothetical protein
VFSAAASAIKVKIDGDDSDVGFNPAFDYFMH